MMAFVWLLYMALQLQVYIDATATTWAYDEVYLSVDDATRRDGIETAPLTRTQSATDDEVDTSEVELTLKTRLFLDASEPILVPDPGAHGHRARLLLDGTEVYSGVIGLVDADMVEYDDDRLWFVTLRADAAEELEDRLAGLFSDEASVRARLSPVGLPTAAFTGSGSRAPESDWYELSDLWAAVLAECDASHVGPAVQLQRRSTIDVAGTVEETVETRRGAVRGTGIDGIPQWTGLELSERLGEVLGWRLLPTYGAWPTRTIIVDAVMGTWREDTTGLRVLPDVPASAPRHTAAPAEIRRLGIQHENLAETNPLLGRPRREAVYASEQLTLDAGGVGQNGTDGDAMIDLGWRLPQIEVTETDTQTSPRPDGRERVRITNLGNALIPEPPDTNYLVEIGPLQVIPSGTQETIIATQEEVVQESGGGTVYRSDQDPLGYGSATGVMWLWEVHRQLAVDRAEVAFAIDGREAPDGVGVPGLLERVVWRGRVWEVVEVETDLRYPIRTQLVLARPARLAPNWY